MKKRSLFALALLMLLMVSGCGSSAGDITGDLPPMIVLEGKKYTAPYMPVNELPEGYTYWGDLTAAQANDTGLAGCGIYVNAESDGIPDFYLYQECGTPIDENTIDSTKIQWAYVQWIQVEAE